MRTLSALIGCVAVLAGAGVAAAEKLDVADFVRRAGNPPYEQASRDYGEKDLDTLLRMLKDKGEWRWWPNVATTIGYIGSPKGVDPLIAFVKGDPDQPDDRNQVISARAAALLSLGVIVNKTNDKNALTFITQVAEQNPAVLQQFKWLAGKNANKVQAVRRLTIGAIHGLGVSGKEDAAKVLEAILQKDAGGMEGVTETAKQALEINQALQRGQTTLSEYFNRGPGPG